MKIKELIKMLEEFEDWEVDFSLGMVKDNSSYGVTLVTFDSVKIGDKSHSEKLIRLDLQ